MRTKVFVTRTGQRYHAVPDCPSFEDAERDGRGPIRSESIALRDVDESQQTPCGRCWHIQPGYDEWTLWTHEVELSAESEYETAFARLVVPRLGIRPADVSTQVDVRTPSRAYRIDFVIRSSGTTVLIEIDGRMKSPDRDVAGWQREVDAKRADLLAHGHRVVNLSTTRVANAPDQCVTEVMAALKDAPKRPQIARTDALDPRRPAAVESVSRHSVAPSAVSAPPTPSRGRLLVTGLVALGVILAAVIGWQTFSQVGPDAAGSDVSTTGEEVDEPGAPENGECPSHQPVKGNINAEGEKIFHEPGWRYYDATDPEACFATAAEALSDGFRESSVQ
ncbi:MAG TPA: hypothetical protein VGE77_04130 [Nocardioides sp.]